MIMTRTPLRVSFVGGGSDLPAFLEQGNMGAVVSAAIDRYIYITVSKHWRPGVFRIGYSRTETVNHPRKIEHELVRESLNFMDIHAGLEITSIAEVPGRGTGLGSSSSYTVGLLHALTKLKNKPNTSPKWLAWAACQVEIDLVGKPIGRQDQYAAAFGGFNYIRFDGEKVDVEPIMISQETLQKLNDRLLLLYTGFKRYDDKILREQNKNLLRKEEMVEETRKMVGLASQAKEALENGKLDDFGCILGEGWECKKKLSKNISNPRIDELCEAAKKAGAFGVKISGAGGGGFLVLFAEPEDHKAIRESLKLREIKVSYGVPGSICILDDREDRGG